MVRRTITIFNIFFAEIFLQFEKKLLVPCQFKKRNDRTNQTTYSLHPEIVNSLVLIEKNCYNYYNT